MDSQISIPDLDDDTIYNINNDDSSFPTSNENAARPRPFRGAELNHHSRSGSNASFGSSNGSRQGGTLMTAGGSSGSGSRLTNATSNVNANGSSSSSSFPRKGSFASLKAAIKGQSGSASQVHMYPSSSTSIQDAYPTQLRNPFHPHSDSKSASPVEGNTKVHLRNDSLISAASRGRAGGAYTNTPQMMQYPRHNQQNSYISDYSQATSGGMSESAASTASSMPPLPPFPEAYVGNNGPPAKTAYARSMSSRMFHNNASESNEDIPPMTAPLPASYHGRNNGSYQSSNEPQSAPSNWVPDSMGGYTDPNGPLLPPPPVFAAESWQHGRGSSGGGSVMTSDEGGSGQGSSDQRQRGNHATTASGNSHHWNQSQPSQFFQSADNTSHAVLPMGVGLEEPVTPSEYAINVLCSRFVTLAGVRVRGAMGGVDESDPSLERILGPQADPQLDALLDSLAHICRKNAKPVTDSLFRWRSSLLEEKVDMGEVRGALAGSQAGLSLGVKDIVNVLTRRKTLATAYMLARSLSHIASGFVPSADGRIGGLSEVNTEELQMASFELLKDCFREAAIPTSRMQTEALEATTKLLGVLSKSNFMAIGDRFVAHLDQCQKVAPSSKEGDPSVEAAVLAMRHLKITPYPMELFEEGAEFLEVIAKHFVAAHGQRVKSAYAEALTSLLLPVARSATAELHHPVWIKALDLIAPRAFSMISKPRYWSVAYPLYVAALCVSPEDRFLQSSGPASSNAQTSTYAWPWFVCLEAGVTRLSKDKTVRKVVLDAAVSLLWTYIFRCRESSNTTTKRLEAFFRIWFPVNRTTVFPAEVSNIDSHVLMVHLVLYRHFDFGRDLVLEFMRHQSLSGNTLCLQPELLSKQRMTIAIQAILLTLDSYVRAESPPLPLDSRLDLNRPEMGDELPESFAFAKPEIAKAQEQFNDLIGKIALLCDHQIGTTTIFDEHIHLYKGLSVSAASQKNSGDEDRFIWKVHNEDRFVTAYNKDSQPAMDLLRACFDSWPRCLSLSIPFDKVLSSLFRAYFSADCLLSDSASQCLRRIASQRKGGARAVVAGFIRYIFRQDVFCWEQHPHQQLILSKVESSVKLWIDFLDIWSKELKRSQTSFAGQKGWEMEKTSSWPVIDEVEAIGLFLLCSAWRPLRRQAVSVLRVVAKLDDLFVNPSARKKENSGIEGAAAAAVAEQEEEPSRVIHLLDLHCSRFEDEVKDGKQDFQKGLTVLGRAKTRKWKRSSNAKETLGDLAGSEKTNELMTWFLVIPRFLRMCLEHFPTTVAIFRSFVTTRMLWMEQSVSLAAGTSNRLNTVNSTSTLKGQSAGSGIPMTSNANGTLNAEQSLMAEHWKMYILALCTTTTSIEGQSRTKGEGATSDRVIAAKDLFQKLIPFMASDHARFRDAVISSLGNININLYKTLLETMQTVSSHLVEDFKAARGSARRSKRHEKLRTAVANVIQLTSPHMAKVMSDHGVVFLILQWVKETFNFLTDKEIKTDWEFHKLRRYFAGVVEEFFNSLHKNLTVAATERYLTFETKLRMFRLFREWHSFSQAAKDGPAKLANLLASVAEQYREDRNRETVLTQLRNETQLLSFHASSAMAALCQGVITLVGSPAPAPMSGSFLDTVSLLEWLGYLFKSPAPQNHSVARRALKALLDHNIKNTDLVTKTTDHAFAESEQTTASRSFFAVLSDVLIEKRDQGVLPLQQVLCLGLIKLGHPDAVIRKKAFALLNSIDSDKDDMPSSQAIEGGVSSPLPATYLRAQRDVSTSLADKFPQYKVAMLCEYTLRLPSIDLIRRATTLGLLPEWLHEIQLVQEEYDSSSVILPRRATLVLDNLLYLTIKYGDEHNFEIQDMWASLAEGPQFALNASIVVKFLIQQALYLRSSLFITHAKRAVSCLSHTILAPSLLSELCSYIEPSSMIPVPLELESMSLPDAELDHLYLADIESLLPPPSRKQTFSPGQVAILFVGELTYEKAYLLYEQLPLLLHVIFMNVDSLSPFTQEQVMAMFEQLLRSLTAEHAANGKGNNQTQVDQLFAKGTSIFWTHDDIDVDLDASHTPRTMRATILETLSILASILPNLKARWGNVALFWATSNPVRHMACRSFQAFRTLLPDINYTMLADMLGRLSNTVSDSSRVDNQTFALEILYTLKTVVQSINIQSMGETERQSNLELLCHIFWMNIACLNTVNEAEFCQSIGLMHVLMDRIDLDSEDMIGLLKAKCPDGWEGEMGGIQSLVMRGLKSSTSYQESFRLLARLAKVSSDQLIDHQDSRLGYLFLGALPWFLQMTDEPNKDDEVLVIGVAEDIAKLAAKRKMADMERVATSIAKKRFRTKDDLIRQAINCCVRVGFLPNHAKGATVLLLSLTFNSQEWLQKQTLQILKLFFQSVDTKRDDFYALGSELLMPLLRLLSTSLSLPALEVMEENIVLMASASGDQRSGPSASQIVRMSMQWGNNNTKSRRPKQRLESTATNQSTNEINSLFGQPEESGWSISNIQDSTTRTRINILSVFKSVELLLDTPPVGEVNFVDDYDVDENVFETTMTASRHEGEEEDSRSQQARSLSVPLGGGEEQQQQLNSRDQLQQQPVVDLGDIVNQLHDLSSFFVDDDGVEDTTSRSGHTVQSSNGGDSNHEQIAKILGRRAVNTFAVLQSGSESSLSIDSSIFRENTDDSISPSNSATTTNKRGGVWTRKSIFGSKRGNLAAKTTPTPTSIAAQGQTMAPSDYFSMEP